MVSLKARNILYVFGLRDIRYVIWVNMPRINPEVSATFPHCAFRDQTNTNAWIYDRGDPNI